MILYSAAHGGFAGESLPLGGGAAVFDRLCAEWTRAGVAFRAITPKVSGRDLVRFNERQYASFCRDFEREATEEILKYDPAETAVLSNDVSEGPDFSRLAARGFRVFTIYHVDVVDYVCRMYLRGLIAPQTSVRWYPRLRRILPGIASLVWEKQEASVRYSQGLIVPSPGMRGVLLRCYPAAPPVHVLPWGSWEEPEAPPADIRAEFGVPREARVLLTLSRVSPEKGQDILLESLLDRDPPVWLFICGEPAYMRGRRFLAKLERLAALFRRMRVIFPGHVSGARKHAFFAAADLYVFPSRHESYGLTLMEALAAGLPAVCLDTAGARAVIHEDFGTIVRPRELACTIECLLQDDVRRAAMSQAARRFARSQPFSDQAAKLASILTG